MKSKNSPLERSCRCATCGAHPRSRVAQEHRAINRVLATLNEKTRRHFVGLLAWQWGRGSIERLWEITGLSRPTIRRGRDEVQRVERRTERDRIRQTGAGRPPVEKKGPNC